MQISFSSSSVQFHSFPPSHFQYQHLPIQLYPRTYTAVPRPGQCERHRGLLTQHELPGPKFWQVPAVCRHRSGTVPSEPAGSTVLDLLAVFPAILLQPEQLNERLGAARPRIDPLSRASERDSTLEGTVCEPGISGTSDSLAVEPKLMSRTCIVRLSTKLCGLTSLRGSFSYAGMDCKLW